MFDNPDRFKTEYSPNVGDMVDALLEHRKTEDLAQVEMALTTAICEMTLDTLKTPEGLREFLDKRPGAAELEAGDRKFTAVRADMVYTSAARLCAHERKMYDAVRKEIDNILAAHQPASRPSAPDNGLQPG